MAAINTGDMARIVQALSADSMLGRKPFTLGETRTIHYLEHEFKSMGLQPAFGDSYLQPVPMVEVTVNPAGQMMARAKGKNQTFILRDDYVIFSRRITDKTTVDHVPLVFAGFGIVAPEYQWNDYKDLDVKDKIVLVMVNDPGYYCGDSSFFKGQSMTYYGRWTYKYEEAARQGALGLMIVHDDRPAGYGWPVVVNGAVIPKLYLAPGDDYRSRCAIEGWFTQDAARRLIRLGGEDPDSLFARATRRNFHAVSLPVSLTTSMESHFRYDSSMNVMSMIRGSKRPEECIIYSAHWDHLGIGNSVDGDSIYNGAVDNGTSLAWMMGIARAFKSLRRPPERTIFFLAPTAEEQGLVGAEYYTAHPVIPMNRTIADINNDLMLPIGRMKDVMITGFGQSELEDWVAKYAAMQDRYIVPDPNAHTGMYYRADHFPFAKAGVPSLFVRGNIDQRDKGKSFAMEQEQEYLRKRYHKPADEYDPATWDLSGIVEDARLLFMVGYDLANSDLYPGWKEGSEFREIRAKSLAGLKK